MRTLCDVNALIALCYGGHEHHGTAIRWLESFGESGVLLICRVTHLSLLRLLNSPTVLGRDACSGKQAWEVSDRLFADERFAFIGEPAGIDRAMRAFTTGPSYTPKLWQDAYLAAFAIQARISLATFDKGFSKFKDLSLVLIR